MKKRGFGAAALLLMALIFSGCGTVGAKDASLSIIYGGTAILSLLLLIGYCCLVHKKTVWFLLLFSSVLMTNTGYVLLSVSSCLEMALMANRVAYFGSVFLPLSMLMIILDVTNTPYRKRLPAMLIGLSILVFLIAASPGILDIYYKEVSFVVIDGAGALVKVYGPLHPLYLFYLLGYFSAMVTVIIQSSIKKTIDTTAHAVIIAIAVLVNIGVWFIEQLCSIEFEILSVSYIISELFLLGMHLMVNENQQLKDLVKQQEQALKETAKPVETPPLTATVSAEIMERFMQGLDTLTPTERAIYEAYLTGTTTKEIMSSMSIKENTLKFHNRNLYSKLGVSSRRELMVVYKSIQADTKKNKVSSNITI